MLFGKITFFVFTFLVSTTESFRNNKINTINRINKPSLRLSSDFYEDLNFIHKYLSPFQGVIFLLYHHFIKKNKICYVNFLPLWNTLLFILLPSKAVLGPITGYKFNGKVTNLNSLIRKFIFPLLNSFIKY